MSTLDSVPKYTARQLKGTKGQQAVDVGFSFARRVVTAKSLGRRAQRRRCNRIYVSGTVKSDHVNPTVKQVRILDFDNLIYHRSG